MKTKLSIGQYTAIGFMLFALFFGAGNLIFPAQLGQNAGSEFWPAVIGFLITGVGLPLVGVLAIGFSGSSSLLELSSRVHPYYGVFFTSLLYLTIGPFFAIPRTATVAYDIGFSQYFANDGIALLVYSFIFFAVTLWFSLSPSKLVDRIGKLMAPGIIILLGLMVALALINPMGSFEAPQGDYVTGPFVKGFLEGYNTMDALASLVFAIIVIEAIKSFGIQSKKEILSATVKSGLVATICLGLIYVGIAFLGGTSTARFGIFDTGGPVLKSAAGFYFGDFGSMILGIIIILACLTTSIGLVTSCAEYFHKLIPSVGYKQWAVVFSLVSFVIANFGLANIINFSIPVLMFLYPLAITLMLITFLSPLFNHSRLVYVGTIGVAFCISIIDGIKTFCDLIGMTYFGWLQGIINFYTDVLPLYGQGLGWLLPVLVVLVITGIIGRFQKGPVEAPAKQKI